MATERSPIKVPCENENLPEKENAPDFDEDTLRGELCWASASVIVRTSSISPFSRMYADVEKDIIIHCINTLKDIWTVMTLFYDYNMLFI